MSKLITYRVPCFPPKPKRGAPPAIVYEERSGKVVLAPLDGRTVKFVLQDEPVFGPKLVHYASGMVVGALNPIKVRYWRSSYSMSDRAAALILLSDIAARVGEKTMADKINAAPVINK